MSYENLNEEGKEILTIEKVLGPNSNYDRIIVDLKKVLMNDENRNIVISDFEEAGIAASNEYRMKEGTNPVNLGQYKDINNWWLDYKMRKNIQVPTSVFGRFLYCKGEKELAARIDLGHGPAGQMHPDEYLQNTICPN